MEFYMQLSWQLSDVLAQCGGEDGRRMPGGAKLPIKTKQAFDRFLTYNIADVAPNILDVMHEGLKIRKHVIVPAEVLFQDMFPESLTLDKLGIAQKTCTEVKKLMKRCIVMAINVKRPVERLQTTQLDLNAVLRNTEPVLTLFLEARRRRLGLDE